MSYFKDTTELRKLILDNPELPLIVFCGEDCNSGEWAYEACRYVNCSIQEYGFIDNTYIDKDDYADSLTEKLCYEPEYENMPKEEFEKMIDEKTEEAEFTKCIAVNVG